MNCGFADLARGNFECGLSKLDQDPKWTDDRRDLDGKFDIGFPGAPGWGEELLVASLLGRHAAASKASAAIFASWQLCSILRNDPDFHAHQRCGSAAARPPLAILRHALVGDLLEKPFVPVGQPDLNKHAQSQASVAGVSVSLGLAYRTIVLIPEKSVPVEKFLPIMTSIDAEFISFQRNVEELVDPNDCTKRYMEFLAHDTLDASTEHSARAYRTDPAFGLHANNLNDHRAYGRSDGHKGRIDCS